MSALERQSGLNLPRRLAAAWVLFGALAALAWGGVTAWPHTQPSLLELFHYLPYPVVLLPSALAVPCAMALGWTWRCLAVASLCVCVVWPMGWRWGGGEAGTVPVRFMTYNIKSYIANIHPSGLVALEREFVRQRPDIAVLQDAQLLDDERRRGQPVLKQRWLGELHYRTQGQLLIASRWPIGDCVVGNIPAGHRALQYFSCAVQHPEQPLRVVTTHFVTPRDGLNAVRHQGWQGVPAWLRNHGDRLRQSRLLAAHLAQLPPGPVVLGGDLNAPASSAVVRQLLRTGLRDSHALAGRGLGHTLGHALLGQWGLSFLRIDHVLVSADVGVVASRVGGAEASEHRPVMVDLVLRRH
jgi:endonuclease/exonuclease/phosphatase (EEP) superfamily protein YafD